MLSARASAARALLSALRSEGGCSGGSLSTAERCTSDRSGYLPRPSSRTTARLSASILSSGVIAAAPVAWTTIEVHCAMVVSRDRGGLPNAKANRRSSQKLVSLPDGSLPALAMRKSSSHYVLICAAVCPGDVDQAASLKIALLRALGCDRSLQF